MSEFARLLIEFTAAHCTTCAWNSAVIEFLAKELGKEQP